MNTLGKSISRICHSFVAFDILGCMLSYRLIYRFMGDMNEEQEKSLEEFRKYLKDNHVVDHPMYDDYYLLRFLRARKFDMDKTKLMFHNFVQWRVDNDVDNVIDVSYTPDRDKWRHLKSA